MDYNEYNRLVPPNQYVARHEDMSTRGRLRLIRQEDGDICVAVIGEEGQIAGVEFCIPGTGAGGSPRTFAALQQLAVAIALDNEEDPSRAASR